VREFIVTGFFTGYIPVMPGTFGTLVGVLIYVLLSKFGFFYYALIAVLLIMSVPLTDYAEKHIFHEKDSRRIVLDEVVGFLIAMVSFPFDGSLDSIRFLVIGFLLFRLFDIWKPYPIRDSQNLHGGFAVVIDDVLAAVYTNLFLQFLRLNSGSLFKF
jgi:phosphatidylglycerophosphatase A